MKRWRMVNRPGVFGAVLWSIVANLVISAVILSIRVMLR